MLHASNLAYQYPSGPLIHFPELEVDSGEAMLICGESGCGKTTLLHLLAGLRGPTSGDIVIDGQHLPKKSSVEGDRFRGEHIGIVYQQSYFIESLSVRDNLLLSPYVSSQSKVAEVAHRLGIDGFLDRLPAKLSVGQQQRASIARAVMNTPKLLLADEPTSALDNKNCAHVIELLLEEAKKNNAALLIVTHDDRLRKYVPQSVDLPPLKIAAR